MADVTATSRTLKIENYFVDGDTRTISLKNPRGGISSTEIQELETFMRTNNIIQGDKMQGTFGKISEAKIITETKTYIDFTE